ncbi:MAG: cytochrome c biogenesis protein CcdA, partial [Candidatus Rokubacteria bacterium]|nr:cytochrome c biogenesis protein CcdA [Candidatus Rokubacteria bacterium]
RRAVPVLEMVAGALLVAVGILVMTNYLAILNAYAISLTPEWLFKRL